MKAVLAFLFLCTIFPVLFVIMTGMIILSDLAIGWIILGSLLGIGLATYSFMIGFKIGFDSID